MPSRVGWRPLSSLTVRLAALALIAAPLLPATALAQSGPRPFAVERLAEGVYAVPGDTGRGSEGRPNAGFVVTDGGVLVVDALGSPEEGERLLRTAATVTKQPVRWLLLTHHHPDHHFGAVALRRAGARVIAHPNRATLAAENGDSAFVAAWTEVVGKRAMRGFAFADVPDVPITRDTTVRLGGREIALLQPGAAHTPGDLLVWLPAERILFAGDLLIEDGVTIVVDGDSRALLAALHRIDSLDARLAVVGHGRIEHEPAALVARTRCYVVGLREAMRKAVADGESMSRVLARMPPADRTRPVSRASRERRNAVRVYLEMERELMQLDGNGGGGSGPADSTMAPQAPPCAAGEVRPHDDQ